MQPRRDAVSRGPAVDAAQRVAMAARDIEQRERLQPRGLARQPGEHRPVRQRHGVDARQIAQAAPIVVVIDAVGVHPLIGGAARGEAHGRWNAKVSTVRPGPNAIAMPSPVACDERRMRSSTNTSVADDMLPKSLQHVARVAQRIRRQRQPVLHGIEDRAAAGVHRPQRDVVHGAIAEQCRAMLASASGGCGRAPGPTDASRSPDRRCAR